MPRGGCNFSVVSKAYGPVGYPSVPYVHYAFQGQCPAAPSGRANEVGAPNVSANLENYATILWKTGQDNEAAKMKLGAMGIRYKHGKENP